MLRQKGLRASLNPLCEGSENVFRGHHVVLISDTVVKLPSQIQPGDTEVKGLHRFSPGLLHFSKPCAL